MSRGCQCGALDASILVRRGGIESEVNSQKKGPMDGQGGSVYGLGFLCERYFGYFGYHGWYKVYEPRDLSMSFSVASHSPTIRT